MIKKITPNYAFIKFFLVFLIATTSFESFAQNTGQGQYLTNQTLQHTSGTRKYSIYIPQNYNSSQPVPLVLLFHGFTNDIARMYNDSEMEVLADANNFIYVIPQGLGGFFSGWSIGMLFGGNNDDLGFANSLIASVSANYSINADRVYSTGFSNGGFFSYRLACEASDKIAAIASVAGSMNPNWISGATPNCAPIHQIPVMQITGTTDPTVPIGGGGTAGGASIANVINFWKGFNNTDATPVVTAINAVTERSVYENGNNGATIEFIKITGRAHEWPTTTTAGLAENASIRIWEFFSRYDINGLITPLSTNTFDRTGISIYPNPASEVITVNNINFSEKTPYSILSISGQMVAQGDLNTASQRIDISNLEASVYFLIIGNNSFKIIKY